MLRKVIGHLPHIAYACLPACGITEIGRHFYKKKRERKGKTNQSTTMCETVGEGGGVRRDRKRDLKGMKITIIQHLASHMSSFLPNAEIINHIKMSTRYLIEHMLFKGKCVQVIKIYIFSLIKT